MKKLLIASILVTSSLMAQTHIELKTTDASGGLYQKNGRRLKTVVSECSYTVMDDSYDEKNIRIFLNADEEAKTNFGFAIPKDKLPLKDGAKFKAMFGYEISYRKGILKADRTRSDGINFKDIDAIELSVSPDLMSIVSGKGLTTLKSLVRTLKFKELSCKF